MNTDASGRYSAMYKPFHLIGLELNVSILAAALLGSPTGAARGFVGDVAATAKRDLAAGETLDGEGGIDWFVPIVADAEAVPQTHPRIADTHQMNWANACKTGGEASSPFDYAARLTEVMLLGIVALRTGQGKKIHYDADAMRVTNVEEANRYLTREYRPGWEV
jgi:hypothetical protein